MDESATEDPDQPGQAPTLQVVLVEPRFEANVGSAARVCKNFGVEDLVLVGDVELTDPANIMAVHAKDLIAGATRASSLADALGTCDYVVGFTAITSEKANDHLRDGLQLPEAADHVHAMEGTVALVFGREDYGLYNDELAACDLVVEIPVDPGYPSMNLSHAVAVALYELAGRPHARPRREKPATNDQIERMLLHAEHLARTCDFQAHKVLPTVLALRRVLGRARLSSYEYHRLMGLFSEAIKDLDAWPVPDARWSVVSQALKEAAWGGQGRGQAEEGAAGDEGEE